MLCSDGRWVTIGMKGIDIERKKPRINVELQDDASDEANSKRVQRIVNEFEKGFDFISNYRLAATIFGSSRCNMKDRIYEKATELSYKLSKSGFAILTGGGGGIMEAGNKGAFEAGGDSVGLTIDLPDEEARNKYVKDALAFKYFFIRKVMLSFASDVYIFFPGGFGTLDEFFEIITLIKTNKIKHIPVVLVGKDFWEPILNMIENSLYKKYHTISKEDMDIYHLVDDVDEAHNLIVNLVEKYCLEVGC